MGIASIGPSGLDPFTVTPGPVPEEVPEATPDTEANETPPLPEGAGTVVDTSA